jgi:hypothetical protein
MSGNRCQARVACGVFDEYLARRKHGRYFRCISSMDAPLRTLSCASSSCGMGSAITLQCLVGALGE